MNEYIIEHSKQHFAQAAGTPPTISPLKDIIDDLPGVKQDTILDGKCETSQFDKLTTLYIQNMKKKKNSKSINHIVPINAIKSAFKKWKEDTNTSPSGLHLSHYKSLLSNDGQTYDQNNPNPSDKIWSIILTIINASIVTSTPISRWTRVNQLLLQKVQGNNKIDKQRRINIYEADYNFILKYFWPHTSQQQAEIEQTLGENQFGGRKNHQTHDVAFINELILEHHRLTHEPIAITQHDNKACFDRTIPNIANVCNQKFGVPPKICTLVTTTKKKPTTSYTHKQEFPKVPIRTMPHRQFMAPARAREMLEQSGTTSAYHS